MTLTAPVLPFLRGRWRLLVMVILPLLPLEQRLLRVVLRRRRRRVVLLLRLLRLELLILCVLLRVGGQLSMWALQIIRIPGMRKRVILRMDMVGCRSEALLLLIKRRRW